MKDIAMLRIALMSSFLFYGLFAIGGQVVLIREILVVHFGNELCMGTIFGSWLISISIGAWFGGKISRRGGRTLAIYLILLSLMTILLPLEIIFIRMLRIVLGVPGGEILPFSTMILSLFCLLFPLSFLIGLIFPFGSRSMEEVQINGAQGIGWIYLLEALGSGIGGALLTFWMLSRFSSLQIVSIFSMALLFIVNLTAIFGISQKRKVISFLSVFLFILNLLAYSSGMVQALHKWSINIRWKGFNPGISLKDSIDSIYQSVEIGSLNGQYSIFGNGQLMETFPDEYAFEQIAHIVLNQHPMPERILVIGGGIGGLLKYILRYPVLLLDYVEIDPAIMQLTIRYISNSEMEALKDKRLRTFFLDGRHFIKKTREIYDLVFLNLPDPSTAMINRFYTIEFFKEVKRILSPEGVITLSISSAENYVGESVGNYTGSIYWTLRKVFSFVLATPGERTFIFASDSDKTITSDSRILKERFIKRGIQAQHFSPDYFEILLSPLRVKFIMMALEGQRDVHVNSDWRPISYFYNLVLWHIFSGEKYRVSPFAGLTSLKLWWIVIPIFIFVVFRIALVLMIGERKMRSLIFNPLFAIATTGFAGMSLEMMLIFSFQNIFGYIYQKIGIIVSLFMVGLSAGSFVMNRIILKGEKRLMWILVSIEGGIMVFSFSLLEILRAFFGGDVSPGESPFFILVGITGLLAGLEFPLVSKILIKNGLETGDVAGKVDSLDHLGASIGGAITGTILVPILGHGASCAIVGFLKVSSIVLILFSILRLNFSSH
jgi:spermidine synthase